MTKSRNGIDKNLQNVVDDLNKAPVNSHQAQQMNQKTNDRRHKHEIDHQHTIDMDPTR